MHLKKLELFGFKSFADRTEFGFQSGMTSIVGPNGCGKSNVVDAFKWIFGEQSAKGMRGSEMKDVIFSGTQRRKPTGFSEVTVVFDNEDSFLDIDYSEVAITRRLFRSGESEYLINREKCRLKDIKELVMDTGMGRTSYSILEQGKIDVLLQASQQDRRLIFEEAAGISKYRAKKGEALRALARVEDNLTRLTDIIREVEKRVQRLKAQASKARRYRVLVEKLKELRIRAAAADYRDSVEARTNLAFRLHWAQFQIDLLDGIVTELTDKLDARSRDRETLGSRLRARREELSAQRVDLERTTQHIEHGRQRLSDLEAEKEKKIVSTGETEAALEKVREQVRGEGEELEGLQVEIEGGRELLDRRAEELQVLRKDDEDLQLSVRQKKDELVVLLQKRSRVAGVIVQLKSELQNLESRGGRIQAAIREAGDRVVAEAEQKSSEEEKLREAQEEYRALEQSRRELEAEAERLDNDSRSLGDHLEGTLTELHQKQSRYEVLQALEENLEGVGRGIRDLLGREDELEALGDVHGLLATLIRVDREYALAVESVLGTHAQAMVVETQDGALGLLDIARRENLGAVEVICMDRVDLVSLEEFPAHEGVLGRLRDRVDVPALFSGVMDRLLANVLLVNDFPTAIALARNGLRPFRLVTLQGEVIEPWGALSLSGETELGLISRRSEMEALSAEVSRLQTVEADARDRLSSIRERIAVKRAEIDELSSKMSLASSAVAQIEEKIAQRGREIDRLERELAVCRSELGEVEEESARRWPEKAEQEKQLAEVDAEHDRCEEAIQTAESQVATFQERTRTAEEALTQARLQLAQAERKADGLRELLRRQETHLEEKDASRQALLADILTIEARHEETRLELQSTEKTFGEMTERVTALRSLVEADERSDREFQELEQRYHEEIETVRKESARVGEERESARLRDQEQRHQRNTIVSRLEEDYGLDLVELLAWEDTVRDVLARAEADSSEADSSEAGSSEAGSSEAGSSEAGSSEAGSSGDEEKDPEMEALRAADPAIPREALYLIPDPEWDRENTRQEVKNLQERMRRMGSVNLEALEELEELEGRYEFQKAQREDLVNSETNLRGIIDEINHTSRQRFLETFEVVRTHFTQLFRKCFGGGKAELLLEEGVDVLDAGIEIVARPPGKKISSLSLMSGGEKTMTTIALLFAIMRARPSPFCILDEVDAPLDEVNVGRFGVLLKEFQEDTQFIVVTHNKSTMAQADTLYGVTMQERGVTTRVAVELESFDAEAMARAAVGGSEN